MGLDINELYRRVIYQNNTLTDLLTTSRSASSKPLRSWLSISVNKVKKEANKPYIFLLVLNYLKFDRKLVPKKLSFSIR